PLADSTLFSGEGREPLDDQGHPVNGRGGLKKALSSRGYNMNYNNNSRAGRHCRKCSCLLLQVELVPGGANIPVTPLNVYEYVRKYAEYRMLVVAEQPLHAMRKGLLDVLPKNSLEDLTAEDFRLLVNGCGEVNVQMLISYTSFNDESGENAEKLLQFKRWFWSIVEKMSMTERQDLVYFWTSSPSLPASEEGFQPMPSITIRPPDDQHLPTANTCISRLYVPLYSSKQILKQKLLLAIKTKNFGFV
ncbi:E3 ubiquitin-protein ligase UBR5-like, partial [Leucoraja erinacea]|uniref:E3 ubiquitin-protein ligase UBR5-like n=1 Tax=Leucoraja erinaceus TaxID=7782 RepID=UPI002457B937